MFGGHPFKLAGLVGEMTNRSGQVGCIYSPEMGTDRRWEGRKRVPLHLTVAINNDVQRAVVVVGALRDVATECCCRCGLRVVPKPVATGLPSSDGCGN